MSDRYLLHKPSGVIYIWQGVYAKNPDFVEVADLQGTPLKPAIDGEFAVVEEPVVAASKQPAKRAKKAAEKPAEAPVDPLDDLDALLNADASRGL